VKRSVDWLPLSVSPMVILMGAALALVLVDVHEDPSGCAVAGYEQVAPSGFVGHLMHEAKG